MKIGIMQPYYMPYIGYFQLIDSVDKFVVCDDVQYIKQGWINRNRILVNGAPKMFTFSLKKGHQKDDINKRYFNARIQEDFNLFLKTLESAYRKAPYYEEIIPLIKDTLNYDESMNIADFNYNALKIVCDFLDIKTEFLKSSDIEKDNSLKCEDMVIDMVKRLNGDVYINAIGGQELYSKEVFKKQGIDLYFINTNDIKYKQLKNEFQPNLSIIDLLMFNSKEDVQKMIKMYELV